MEEKEKIKLKLKIEIFWKEKKLPFSSYTKDSSEDFGKTIEWFKDDDIDAIVISRDETNLFHKLIKKYPKTPRSIRKILEKENKGDV